MVNRPSSSPAPIGSAQERRAASGGPVFRLGYVSEVSPAFSATDLDQIRRESASRNAEADITGVLVMDAGKILQILEGDRARVLDLFERISRDRRHCKVRQAVGQDTNERFLHSWSMVSGEGRGVPDSLVDAFHALHKRLSAIDDLTDVTEDEVDLLKVMALLRSVPI